MTTKSTLLTAWAFALALAACDDNDDSKPSNATYTVDETSVVEWHGAGTSAQHDGSFAVNGTLLTDNNRLTGGTFTIPIASIKNFDLPDTLKPVLVHHLQSEDFFHMAVFPNASFTITSVTDKPTSSDEAVAGANALIKGKFTLLGQTLPLEFPAKVDVQHNRLVADAVLSFDRTLWGMTYAADPALGEFHIFPTVNIHVKLTANKK